MLPSLILGYGNLDRQDDGVAWHVINRLAKKLDKEFSEQAELDVTLAGDFPHLAFVLQLTPEIAEWVSRYQQVCFVDAHTGAISEDFQLVPIEAGYQASPFTHHMTPSTLLAFSEIMNKNSPSAVLVSIRGYEFGFSNELSQRTDQLADQAVCVILDWLEKQSVDKS